MTLEGHKLTIGYQDRVVGAGLDVKLEKGEVLALLGPNGGGKTTLLKTLLGLLRPKAGEVRPLMRAIEEHPNTEVRLAVVKLLARSATGQKLSSYTTLVRGPRRAGELEGPEEFHLILLDNGRARQIASTLREALYCLRCGACLNVCPICRRVGGHAYGSTYPGPIGSIVNG